MFRVDKTRLLKVSLGKCQHMPAPVHRVVSADYFSTTKELFDKQHVGESSDFHAWTQENSASFDLERTTTVSQLATLFPRLDNINFQCTEIAADNDNDMLTISPESVAEPRNALTELMQNSRKRCLPSPKPSDSSNFNRKDELYNDIVSILKKEGVDFSWSGEAHYCVSVLTNALWYITNHHITIGCIECRKPRVVYCKTKLDFRHKVMLARNISSFEYSCGSELFPPEEKRKLAKAMMVRSRFVTWGSSRSSILWRQ